MKRVTLIKKFAKYSFNAFIPLAILWIPVIFFFGLGGLLNLVTGEIDLALASLAITFLPVPLMFVAYLADQVSKSNFVRGFIIYGFWFVVTFTFFWAFLTTLGGVSMAAVDNPDGWAERNLENITDSLNYVLFAQPIIIILAIIGVYRLKKQTSKNTNLLVN